MSLERDNAVTSGVTGEEHGESLLVALFRQLFSLLKDGFERLKPQLGRLPRTYRLTVSTRKMQLVTENPTRKGLLVYNNGSATVYILSSPALSSSDGIPVAPGGTFEDDDCYGEYWIVADSGSQDVRVLEVTD